MAEADKVVVGSGGGTPQQPGQVVAPGGNTQQPVAPVESTPATPAPKPNPSPELTTASETAPSQPATPQATPQSTFAAADSKPAPAEGDINWTASEFVAHEKSAGWYFGLIIAALAVAGIIFLLTKDLISSGVVLVGALMLAILGSRRPRQLEYQLDANGVSIGQKRYVYEAFRSFSIVPEGAFSSIVFMPLKRFAPLTTIYYAPEDEDKIVNLLSNRLPFQEHRPDAVDSLMRRIRF